MGRRYKLGWKIRENKRPDKTMYFYVKCQYLDFNVKKFLIGTVLSSA